MGPVDLEAARATQWIADRFGDSAEPAQPNWLRQESLVEDDPKLSVLRSFQDALAARSRPRVLELGTRRTGSHTRLHRQWVPDASEYLGTDTLPGPDVDIVADPHALADVCGAGAFDAVVVSEELERMEQPWRVAREISRALKPGGLVFVRALQNFPLRPPQPEFWRFTIESLSSLFGPRNGFAIVRCENETPATVRSAKSAQLESLPAFLHVSLCARKVAEG